MRDATSAAQRARDERAQQRKSETVDDEQTLARIARRVRLSTCSSSTTSERAA